MVALFGACSVCLSQCVSLLFGYACRCSVLIYNNVADGVMGGFVLFLVELVRCGTANVEILLVAVLLSVFCLAEKSFLHCSGAGFCSKE